MSSGETTKRVLGREDSLKVMDLPRELVDVPEWGGAIWVRGMTAEESDSYDQSLINIKQTGNKMKATPSLLNSRAKMVVLCCLNEDGSRMYEDKDAPALGRKSASAIERLVKVIRELSGKGEEADEELGKALTVIPAGDSSSSSPER